MTAYSAPGRVNLIGEHTDYNDGFVLPAAIARYCECTVTPNDTDVIRVRSQTLQEEIELPLHEPYRRRGTWRDYAAGVLAVVCEMGSLRSGADVVITSDVPLGAGLSSSAAFELSFAQALLSLTDVSAEPTRLAEIGIRAEREFVGVRSGVMDQLVSALGVRNCALLIDCRSLQTTPVALPGGLAIAVIDSQTKHGLVHSEYNERRADCEHAVRIARDRGWEITALRDIEPRQLVELQALLPERLFRRARHVVTENERVRTFVSALAANDLQSIGAIMRDSHESLRADYNVTTPALDTIAQAAREVPGVIGARMTGGGFGGSVVALLETGAFDALCERVESIYFRPQGLESSVFLTEAVDGAGVRA